MHGYIIIIFNYIPIKNDILKLIIGTIRSVHNVK
jgi:hypothetical protein